MIKKRACSRHSAERPTCFNLSIPEAISTYLKPKVLCIARRTVNDKWAGLPDGCREEVLAIVKAAERPVLVAFNSEKRRAEAQKTVHKAAHL